jgi:hypothetical protein
MEPNQVYVIPSNTNLGIEGEYGRNCSGQYKGKQHGANYQFPYLNHSSGRESVHIHSHRQTCPPYVAGRNMLAVRIAGSKVSRGSVKNPAAVALGHIGGLRMALLGKSFRCATSF